MFTTEMIRTHPHQALAETSALAACIGSCYACDQACTACADACLSEPMVDQLRACIRLNLDCADACAATARMLSRLASPDPDLVRAQVELCAFACRRCAEECDRHASMHEHCRICAEACRSCDEACAKFLGARVQ